MTHPIHRKTLLFLLIPAIILSLFLSSCGKPIKPVDKSLDGLKPTIISIVPKLKNIDFYGVELEFTTEVMNPYPVSVSNAQFTYSFEVLGNKFLAGDTPVKATFNKSKTSTFVFPVRIEFKKVGEVLEHYSKIKEVSYLLRGSLKFPMSGKVIEIPVEKKGNFPLFHMPEFHNVKLDSTDPSFFNVAVTIKADLKNTNGFPLGIHGLRYAITLGEMTVGELKVHTDRSIKPDKFGKITIIGKISAARTIMEIFNGKELGMPKLEASGIIDTPYGKIKIHSSEPTKD